MARHEPVIGIIPVDRKELTTDTALETSSLRRALPRVSWVACGAAIGPVAFLGGNWTARPSLGVTLAWFLIVLAIGLAAAGVRRANSRHFVVLLVLAALGMWPAIRSVIAPAVPPVVEALLGLAVFAIVAMIARRISGSGIAVASAVVAGVLLASTVTLLGAISASGVTYESATVELSASANAPDVYLVVLDAYGREDVLAEMYGVDQTEFLAGLESNGFRTVGDAQANYSMTLASLSSILLMDYPIAEGESIQDPQRSGLFEVMAGDNAVVDSLRGAGYEYVHIESGWGGTKCSEAADRCVSAGIYEETLQALLNLTPFGALVESTFGHAFSYTAAAALDATIAEAGRSDGPKFVFAHVLLPHPPSHLDASCDLTPGADRRGLNVAAPLMSDEEKAARRALYVDQLECVNLQLEAFVDAVPDDAIIILTSDHGPDSGGQLFKPTEFWTNEDIAERMRSFVAIRAADGCRVDAETVGVNVFREIFRCEFGGDIELLEQAHYVVNVQQVLPNDITRRVLTP